MRVASTVERIERRLATSGQTARINGVRRYVGAVGQEVSEADAYLSARDAMLNCLGDAGRHARSVVGLSSLPSNVSVEVELVVEVR